MIRYSTNMILYNANDPEILGKKQYDVLRGFGRWCIIFSISAWLMVLSFINTRNLPDEPVWPILIGCFGTVWFVSPYLFALGISAVRGATNINPVLSWAKWGFLPMIIASVIFLALSLWAYFIQFNDEKILQPFDFRTAISIVSCILVLLFAYVLWILVKIFRQPKLIYNVHPEKSDNDDINPSFDPKMVCVCEWVDPLKEYGRILMLGGYTIGLVSIMFAIGYYIKHSDYELLFIATTGVSVVTGSVCIGFSRRQEWARAFMIIIHSAVILLIFIILMKIIENTIVNVYNQQNGVPLNRAIAISCIMLSVAHWCYFVIKTLTSPVIKYLYYRGGHRIE